MIQKCRQNLRQSDELLFNKDKNKDDFSNKNCISLEIKKIKEDKLCRKTMEEFQF